MAGWVSGAGFAPVCENLPLPDASLVDTVRASEHARRSTVNNETIACLAADSPLPELASRLALFGQFVGSWEIDGWALEPDGGQSRFEGEWHFAWALEGRSIQDVLIVWPPGGRSDRARGEDIGSTFRTYDPKREAWWVSWHGPSEGSFAALLAREVGERIVLEGQWSLRSLDDPDRRFEWSFNEIRADSFVWQGRRSRDAGATWELVEEMRATRKG